MSKELKVYRCAHCGNIIEFVEDHGVPIMCCGQKMDEVKAGSTDAALEKHVPVVTIEEGKVKACVGSTLHPMTEEHLISKIWLLTDKGVYRRDLVASDKPEAEFVLSAGEQPIAVYEWCNLHGLWKTDL